MQTVFLWFLYLLIQISYFCFLHIFTEYLYFMKTIPVLKLLLFGLSLLFLASCNESDDNVPIITLNSSDSLAHVLNQVYVDPGAIAIDESDGDISSSIYIENRVNENLVGEYTITYNVVDDAGNEALPRTRWVFVDNTARIYDSLYFVSEQKIFPQHDEYNYSNFIFADTLVNQRVFISSLAGDLGQFIYADISESVIVIPFQTAQYDSLNSYTIQGDGTINDSVIRLKYTKTDSDTSFWNSELIRY